MSLTRNRSLQRVLVAALPLLLAACFLLPGKFVSSLDVKADGRFTFAYKGEIVLVVPPGAESNLQPVKDDPAALCYGPVPREAGQPAPPPRPAAGAPPLEMVAPGRVGRPCTPAERSKRSAEIARSNADAATRRKADVDRYVALFGMNPSDDASMQAFAAQLVKQAGWRSAVYRGKGVFDVDFEQSGLLDRDFVFPVAPRATVLLPFVIVRRRADGTVQVTAPAFRSNPGQSLLSGFGDMSPGGPTGGPANAPQGSFTVTTDTAPLTNNTDDGPTRDGGRTALRWTVGQASDKVPEALLPLAISR